jgi:hypothetical protein
MIRKFRQALLPDRFVHVRARTSGLCCIRFGLRNGMPAQTAQRRKDGASQEKQSRERFVAEMRDGDSARHQQDCGEQKNAALGFGTARGYGLRQRIALKYGPRRQPEGMTLPVRGGQGPRHLKFP